MPPKFSKKEKVKSKILLGNLFEKGRPIKQYPLKLLYIKTDPSQDVKVKCTVAVPKKSFKKAVDRNRIKRLIKEAYRLNKDVIFNNIEGNYAFVFLYLGKEIPDYQKVEQALKNILDKLLLNTNEA